jgi:predicted RNase H-like HicB family nuclease
MPRKVSVVIEHDEHGHYAYCPELPGCHSQGPTLEMAIERIKEAVDLYLETLSPEEIDSYLSKEILTTSIEVRVA